MGHICPPCARGSVGISSRCAGGTTGFAQGTVSVDSKRKTIQHLEGGIVSAIHVREGDVVKSGDVLVELDDLQSRARRDLISTRYYGNATMIDRLKAERAGARKVQFSADVKAAQTNPDIADLVREQEVLFKARRAQLDGQVQIYRQRIRQLQQQIEGLISQREAGEQSLALLQDELDRSLPLYEKGIVDLPTISNYRREIARTQGDIGRIASEISSARVAQGEAELEIIQIKKNFEQEVSAEISAAQEEYFDLKEQLGASEDVLKRTQVLAPQSGTVLALAVHTIGGVLPPGERILDIVPDDDLVVIEARIRPTDVDNVSVGQSVRIRFTAFKQRSSPELTGIVDNIGADALGDSETGESFYLARIIVPEDEIARLDKVEIVPGMPADIMVEGESRTLLEYLLDPVEDVVSKGLKEE
ncbi:MAG: HlyD family type I secretion periplasmic adaptor subunit [Alphaproteobacteria bacterium]